ncbi:MAG: hypothetical protein QFX36_06150 [Archaeoglobales archaeon]|nr:hypothetical protein [Archaeoglobales archaeon]MDI9643294.1 hypothetical protein [Archaeoglobales archaeon]
MSELIRLLMRTLPKEYEEPMQHVLKAKIEYLKALNSLIELIIKDLEKMVEEEPKREKLKVE